MNNEHQLEKVERRLIEILDSLDTAAFTLTNHCAGFGNEAGQLMQIKREVKKILNARIDTLARRREIVNNS